MPNKLVPFRERRVDLSAYSNKTAGDSKLQIILLRVKRYDPGSDGTMTRAALGILGNHLKPTELACSLKMKKIKF